jgi:hypothetical protein
MRTLTLNGQHRTVFKHLYFGFLQGGNNLSKEAKPRSTVRLEARIQAKFDAVMQDDPDDRNLPWQLRDGEQVLVLTSEEYQHVDKCLDAVAWPTVGAKGVAEMLDVWGDAQKTE